MKRYSKVWPCTHHGAQWTSLRRAAAGRDPPTAEHNAAIREARAQNRAAPDNNVVPNAGAHAATDPDATVAGAEAQPETLAISSSEGSSLALPDVPNAAADGAFPRANAQPEVQVQAQGPGSQTGAEKQAARSGGQPA